MSCEVLFESAIFFCTGKGVSQIPSTSLPPPPPPPNQTQGSLSDVTIILPEDSVTLTGGLVDHGAAEPVQYRWSRSDSSPAIGVSGHHHWGVVIGVWSLGCSHWGGHWGVAIGVWLLEWSLGCGY